MKKIILIAAAVVMGFTACRKEDGGNGSQVKYITKLVASQATTKVVTADDAGLGVDQFYWKAGDKIALWELMDDGSGGCYIPVNNGGTASTDAQAPVMYILDEGAGCASATFVPEDPSCVASSDKLYVAVHANKCSQSDGLIRYEEGCFRVQGCGDYMDIDTEDYTLTEDNISFYSPVEYDGADEVKPLVFKMVSECIMEFNLSLEASVASYVRFISIKLDVNNPNDPGETVMPFVAGQWGKLDMNINMVFDSSFGPSGQGGIVDAQKFPDMTLDKFDGMRDITSGTPLKLRYPMTWMSFGEGLGDKNIIITLTLFIDGEEKSYTYPAITRIAPDSFTPVFQAGKTYVKDIVLDQATLDLFEE